MVPVSAPWKQGRARHSCLRQTIVDESPTEDDRKFHGWRLLGILAVVVLALAIVSAVVDWVVLGSLFDRVG